MSCCAVSVLWWTITGAIVVESTMVFLKQNSFRRHVHFWSLIDWVCSTLFRSVNWTVVVRTCSFDHFHGNGSILIGNDFFHNDTNHIALKLAHFVFLLERRKPFERALCAESRSWNLNIRPVSIAVPVEKAQQLTFSSTQSHSGNGNKGDTGSSSSNSGGSPMSSCSVLLHMILMKKIKFFSMNSK